MTEGLVDHPSLLVFNMPYLSYVFEHQKSLCYVLAFLLNVDNNLEKGCFQHSVDLVEKCFLQSFDVTPFQLLRN